ncbi:MAG: T9SS type A sorting domain-containing protein [Bacteroidales bacterium]|nr:T9SS type A sorting domain-containing protein [Bacteroidales bacterium]
MRSLSLNIIITFISLSVFAQYPTGHRTITYQDPARSDRNIETEIYYPAVSAGNNTDVASGQFPILVFGHGFVMSVSSYENIWTVLTPLGYIVALPTTEGGAPNHSEFGKDLAFLISKLQSEGSNASSPFYQKVGTTSAMMGHSMGGGVSFLGCENNTLPTVMVTFAAAVTNPSSTTAAANVTIPTLVISGADDCVAPPDEHQLLMYNALASSCKVYISITNGGHCNFANYNLACTFGEETCNPGGVDITRKEQQAITMSFLIPYLDFFLKGVEVSWYEFTDSLTNSTKITHIKNCDIDPSGIAEAKNTEVNIYPNPSTGNLNISLAGDERAFIELSDITGRVILKRETDRQITKLDISTLIQGVYFVKVINANDSHVTRRIIKM